MIPLITTLLIALAWLGYETDWVTVRLPYGIEALIAATEVRRPWNHFDWHDWVTGHHHISFTDRNVNVHSKSHVQPICGWDWIRSREHIIPECKVELVHSGVKYNMTIKSPAIIKSVVTALRAKPARPYPKMSYSRNKNGGMRFSPMIPRAV